MGDLGLEALSQLSGIVVDGGTYTWGEDGKVLIQAQGSKDGRLWDISCFWDNGQPKLLILKPLQEGL